ncbi:MAG: hypothetical protein JWP92_2432 [Caulobacter sp.]|nr:hypothetical protein [Caulobacter sp.]
MDEIDDIAAERGLAADVEVQAAKRFPEDSLADRHLASQPLGALDCSRCVQRLWWLA